MKLYCRHCQVTGSPEHKKEKSTVHESQKTRSFHRTLQRQAVHPCAGGWGDVWKWKTMNHCKEIMWSPTGAFFLSIHILISWFRDGHPCKLMALCLLLWSAFLLLVVKVWNLTWCEGWGKGLEPSYFWQEQLQFPQGCSCRLGFAANTPHSCAPTFGEQVTDFHKEVLPICLFCKLPAFSASCKLSKMPFDNGVFQVSFATFIREFWRNGKKMEGINSYP